MQYELHPIRWDVVYPVHVDPIGEIVRTARGFQAWCGSEDLGEFDSGDAAAEAVWKRFLDQSAAQHAHAAVTHGGRGRHQ